MNEPLPLEPSGINVSVGDITDSGFKEQFSHFLTRTETIYAKSPLSLLSQRGIENRLFDNLVEYLPKGVIIAGGFITNVLLDEKNATDIDFFFTSAQSFVEMIEFLKNPPPEAWAYVGYKIKGNYDKNNINQQRYITFIHDKRPAIQLLRMVWYESAEHVIDTFDLNIVQFAVDSQFLYYNPPSFLDLSRKRILLHRMQFPASTLRRIIKYAKKGFYACPGALVKICEEIQKFNGSLDANAVVYVD